jgi:hypothetical protein
VSDITVHHDDVHPSRLVLPGANGALGLVEEHGARGWLLHGDHEVCLQGNAQANVVRWSLIDDAGRSVRERSGGTCIDVSGISGHMIVQCELSDHTILRIPIIE